MDLETHVDKIINLKYVLFSIIINMIKIYKHFQIIQKLKLNKIKVTIILETP